MKPSESSRYRLWLRATSSYLRYEIGQILNVTKYSDSRYLLSHRQVDHLYIYKIVDIHCLFPLSRCVNAVSRELAHAPKFHPTDGLEAVSVHDASLATEQRHTCALLFVVITAAIAIAAVAKHSFEY